MIHQWLTAFVLPDTSFQVMVPICNRATMPSNATKVASKWVIEDVTHIPRHPNSTTQSCYIGCEYIFPLLNTLILTHSFTDTGPILCNSIWACWITFSPPLACFPLVGVSVFRPKLQRMIRGIQMAQNREGTMLPCSQLINPKLISGNSWFALATTIGLAAIP